MRKPVSCICIEHVYSVCFHFIDSIISSFHITSIRFMPLARVCRCADWYVWDLVRTPKTGFLVKQLSYYQSLLSESSTISSLLIHYTITCQNVIIGGVLLHRFFSGIVFYLSKLCF